MDRDDAAEINFRILVICTGNLCRSPFAGALLEKRLAELDLDDIAVRSAGVAAPEGQGCPVVVLEAAREWDVDLERHRARQVGLADVEVADLILTMDRYQHAALLAAYPLDEEKVHPLAQFDDVEGLRDIEDPMGMDLDGTREVFARIAVCVENLARYYAEP